MSADPVGRMIAETQVTPYRLRLCIVMFALNRRGRTIDNRADRRGAV